MINRGWNPRVKKPYGKPTPKRVELEVMTTKNAQTRQHIYTTHNQHIQHLRRCAVIATHHPPVTPAAIHIEEPLPVPPQLGGCQNFQC